MSASSGIEPIYALSLYFDFSLLLFRSLSGFSFVKIPIIFCKIYKSSSTSYLINVKRSHPDQPLPPSFICGGLGLVTSSSFSVFVSCAFSNYGARLTRRCTKMDTKRFSSKAQAKRTRKSTQVCKTRTCVRACEGWPNGFASRLANRKKP